MGVISEVDKDSYEVAVVCVDVAAPELPPLNLAVGVTKCFTGDDDLDSFALPGLRVEILWEVQRLVVLVCQRG